MGNWDLCSIMDYSWTTDVGMATGDRHSGPLEVIPQHARLNVRDGVLSMQCRDGHATDPPTYASHDTPPS